MVHDLAYVLRIRRWCPDNVDDWDVLSICARDGIARAEFADTERSDEG